MELSVKKFRPFDISKLTKNTAVIKGENAKIQVSLADFVKNDEADDDMVILSRELSSKNDIHSVCVQAAFYTENPLLSTGKSNQTQYAESYISHEIVTFDED